MPTYRFIDYNELTSKPDIVDMFAIYDIDADELKKFSYATLKSFFIKTDEPTDVEAIVEFQSTSTKPNSLLKFGSAGEFRIYSDGTDLFMKGTSAAGKLRFYANSIEMLCLCPVNSSIATLGMAINKDGTAGVGINFDASNRPVLLSILQCDAGIATKLKNISYTGAANTGLQFSAANVATFKQGVLMESTLGITDAVTMSSTCWHQGNIRIAGNYISYGGTAAGISLTAANNVSLTGGISMGGNCTGNGFVAFLDYLSSQSYVEAGTYLKGDYLNIKDAITAPSTSATRALIYVDSADGDLKVKFGDGIVKTLATDT